MADHHTISRKENRLLIDAKPHLEVVAETRTGRQTIEPLRQWQPDMVVKDVFVPELNGIDGTRLICEEMKRTKVLGLSMHRFKLRLPAESYRTSNHANFAAPGNSLPAPTFGCLTATATTSSGTVTRVMQLALRVDF
ncbi:MAG: response regulator [Acidobacteriota bacterium]|nr:response regulator [Bryobacteraceae bacterium CoA2 C42]MCA2962401.1 response regulator [Acidobacteriaceae bacterium]